MPLVSVVDGIEVHVEHDPARPPFVRIVAGGRSAEMTVGTLEVTSGELPEPELEQVRAWIVPRLDRLVEAWRLHGLGVEPEPID